MRSSRVALEPLMSARKVQSSLSFSSCVQPIENRSSYAALKSLRTTGRLMLVKVAEVAVPCALFVRETSVAPDQSAPMPNSRPRLVSSLSKRE